MTSRLLRSERVEHLHGTCRACGQPVLHVVAVGWFDPARTHPYDVCPGDRFGNHTVDPTSVHGNGLPAP
jgi:hypothetical protein